MAWDAFLTLEGVKGESQRKGHEGEIELISFSFGATNPSSIGIGSGGGTGKVSLSSFNVMKKTDASSVGMFQASRRWAGRPGSRVRRRSSGSARR